MPNVKNNAAAQETCRRLIYAAGEVFAEHGLHAATIKEITERAGVNIAAINYHFRDKFELYAAVVRQALSLTPVAPAGVHAGSPPEERLGALVRHMVEDLYDPARPVWCATLLAHEFAQPTAALDAVMEELVRPRADYLHDIVRQILGPEASEMQVLRASLSVASQSFVYLYNPQMIKRLHAPLLEANREELVTHIMEFSMAGLHALRRKYHGEATPRKMRRETGREGSRSRRQKQGHASARR